MDKLEIQKMLLLKEGEIVIESLKFCRDHDIVFTKEHDTMLRNAMRAFFSEGIKPIIKEIWDIVPTEDKTRYLMD